MNEQNKVQKDISIHRKKILKQILSLSCLVIILLLPFFVFAQSATLEKLKDVGSNKGPFVEPNDFSFAIMVGIIIKTFLSLLGIFFITLMILGGYNWMTAQGDESKVEKAKKIITNAIIGLIITLSSYVIWDFVLYKIIIGT